MKKLLELGQAQLASGLNGGGFFNDVGGLWQAALGLNAFMSSDSLSGLVAGASASAEPGSGVVTDNLWAGASIVYGSNAGYLYLWGDGGKMYYTDLSGDNIVVYTGTTVASPANGLDIFKTSTSNYLYYFQLTQIGRAALDASGAITGYTSNWATGLQSTKHHPTHPFLDRLYYGNGYYVGYIYDVAGTATNLATALDMPTDWLATCLSNDGQYLVIGATKNLDTNSNPAGIYTETKILFWDTNANSWQKEYTLPSASINALKRVGSTIYAVCPEGVYAFNFNEQPVLIRELSNTNGIRFGFPNAIDQYGDGVIFGNELTVVGKPASYAKRGIYTPLLNPASTSGDVGLIWVNPRINRVLLSTLNSKWYRLTTNTNGAPNKAWKTKLLDLGGRFKIQQIEFILGAALASGDAITVSVVNEALTATTFNAVSFTNDGAVTRVKTVPDASTPTDAPETELMGLTLTITGGVPLIRKINVYGEPVVQT